MTKLSETLPPAKEMHACQQCGGKAHLHRHMECGDADEPTHTLIILCDPCAKAIVPPHPRLYRQLDNRHPWPGAMAICLDCKHRQVIRCGHPEASCNGGKGVALTYPAPTSAFVDGTDAKGKRCGWRETFWHGPVSACAQKEAA